MCQQSVMHQSTTFSNQIMNILTFPLKVDLRQIHFIDEQFYQLCVNNPDLNIESSANETLILMPSVGGEKGNWKQRLELTLAFGIAKVDKVFRPSTLFRLPGEGRCSPDAAWVELAR